ncbi:TetR/AcrR family transcriptional regulator [Fodinicola feengrottensis]|uniref:TetR/AcrR family transcriptional regulator n=1 Tax=Fodinicola feengrottensis TaxID=435914 RepID=A0ABN2JBP6_9ACTN|nr:TetR/AcrR family transcriptional regulator [Fodinicola feengrottensis]
MSTLRAGYHHGDLRAACLAAALSLLEEGDEGDLSLRAVARRAGVSPTAPYRHYPDKDALLAALAIHGYRELRAELLAADSAAAEGDEYVAMAQAYVAYAVAHPALFRLMFDHACTRSHPETTAASAAVTEVLAARVAAAVPAAQRPAFMIGCWALVHGLGSLLLNGKLTPNGPDEVAELTRAVVATMLGSSALRL